MIVKEEPVDMEEMANQVLKSVTQEATVSHYVNVGAEMASQSTDIKPVIKGEYSYLHVKGVHHTV